MTLERCSRILCCGVRQENGRWPRRFQALLKDTTTTGRPQGLLPGGTSASALEERSRKVPALRARSPVLCVYQSRRPLLGLSLRFHRPPGRRPAGLLSDRHRRTRLGSSNPLDRGRPPSLAFQLGIYLPISALASISLLQSVKGAVVALQWSLKMHGFGVHPPDELQPWGERCLNGTAREKRVRAPAISSAAS